MPLRSTAPLALALCLGLFGFSPASADEAKPLASVDATALESVDVDGEGRPHGKYTLLHASGETAVKATYRHGELHGLHRTYNEAGRLSAQKTYRKGVLHGSFKEYHANRRLKLTATYRDGKLHGAYHVRAADGSTLVKTSYKHGLRDGTFKAWEGSRVVTKQTWRNGVPTDVDGIAPYPRTRKNIVSEIQRLLAGDGELSDDPLEADRELALRYLKAYRCIAGVPYDDIEINAGYQLHAQAAAEICKTLGQITHFPKNPGWASGRFDFAAKGTKSSNLAQGRIACDSIRAYMDDSDARNIDKVGHRAWCLNPAMTQTGFGTVDHFSAMWSISSDRKHVPDYEFVACPSAGQAPAQWFDTHWAWSASLNPAHFDAPQPGAVQIAVTPVDETFLPTGAPLALNHLSVLQKSAGVPYMVVFRPVGVTLQPGAHYRVTVSGLTHKGKAKTLRYYVAFFDCPYVAPRLPSEMPLSVLSR